MHVDERRRAPSREELAELRRNVEKRIEREGEERDARDGQRTHEEEMKQIARHLEDATKGMEDVTKRMEDATKRMEDATKRMEGATKRMADVKKSMEDAVRGTDSEAARRRMSTQVTNDALFGDRISQSSNPHDTSVGELPSLIA